MANEEFEKKVEEICFELADILKEKNRAYGDSALNPVRIFSKADPIEQLRVRIDDKLSRIVRGTDSGEDVRLDLMGYLLLWEAHDRIERDKAAARDHAAIEEKRNARKRLSRELKMKDATWDRVRELVRQGKAPSIEIQAAQKVILRRPRGRQRIRGPRGEVYHFKMHTSNGQPMSCRWFGCTKRLSRDQVDIVCCPEHGNALREYCEETLAVLKGEKSAVDYPMAFRSRHGKHKKTKEKRGAK